MPIFWYLAEVAKQCRELLVVERNSGIWSVVCAGSAEEWIGGQELVVVEPGGRGNTISTHRRRGLIGIRGFANKDEKDFDGDHNLSLTNDQESWLQQTLRDKHDLLRDKDVDIADMCGFLEYWINTC